MSRPTMSVWISAVGLPWMAAWSGPGGDLGDVALRLVGPGWVVSFRPPPVGMQNATTAERISGCRVRDPDPGRRGKTGREPSCRAPLIGHRLLAGRPSPRGSALLLGRAAPDAMDLPCSQRERQAFAPNAAGRADRFGLGHLLPGRAGIRDRKEQIGVGKPAGGSRPPVSAGDEPRRPGLVGPLPAFGGSSHQSASSTSAAAQSSAVDIIQFTASGRGSIVGAACRGIAVSYGVSGSSGVREPGRHVLSTVVTGNRTI